MTKQVYWSYYRKSRPKKIRWIFWLIFFFINGLLIFAIYLVFWSNFLKVQKLVFENNRFITVNQLMPALTAAIIQKENWRSWLTPERLIFWLGVNQPSISEKLPLVEDVKIKINFKSRHVVVKIQERTFAGLWCSLNKECFVFDQEGVVFSRAPYVEGNIFIKIIDQETKNIRLGQIIFNQFQWLSEIQEITNTLKLNKIDFNEIVIKPYYLKEWEVNLIEGPILKFSFGQKPIDFEKTIVSLRKTLNWPKLIYLDFRVQNRVYYQ